MNLTRDPAGIRILLFDDDPEYARTLKAFLETALFSVLVLPRIDLAFGVLRDNKLSILIWGLKCAHGEAVARLGSMRQHGVRIPILAVVGSATTKERNAMLTAGADDVLLRSDGMDAVVAHTHVLSRRLVWENVVIACDEHLTANMHTHRLRWIDEESQRSVRLSQLEMELFLLLLENLGELVRYERIAACLSGPRNIWDRNAIYALKLKLVAKISRLTPSLKVSNEHGEGYLLKWVRNGGHRLTRSH